MTQDQSETVCSSNRMPASMNNQNQMKKPVGGNGGCSTQNGANSFQPSSSVTGGVETEQRRNRVCRDFVQGTCRKKYCRVSKKCDLKFKLRRKVTKSYFFFFLSILTLKTPIKLSSVMIFKTQYAHGLIASKFLSYFLCTCNRLDTLNV